MFSYARMLVVALAAAVLSPAAASATTVNYNLSKNTPYSLAQVILPAGDVEFAFTALESFKISNFVLSATTAARTGAIAVADLNHIRFGFTAAPLTAFSVVVPFGNSAVGFGNLPGGIYAAGQQFSVFVTDGIVNAVGLTLSFQTAEVPVPAAGLLLAPVLLAGGAVALRRRKAALTAA